MKKFDIRRTFEIFLREPLSILKEGFLQIVNLKTNIFSDKSSVTVDLLGKKKQITVINNDKMYNLFQTVLYKKRMKEQQEKALLG